MILTSKVQRNEQIDTSRFLTKPQGDIRYVNESDDIDMNKRKIRNVAEGVEDDDVCTIQNLTKTIVLYYKKGTTLDMNNAKIINCQDGTDDTDVCNIRNLNK